MVSIARRGRTYSRRRRDVGLGLGFRLRVPTNANLTPTLTKARRYIRSMPFKPPIPPEKIYPNANPLAIEILQKLLVFNPSRRITVDEARSE